MADTPSVPTNRLRIYIDDGTHVWTPVDRQIPADTSDRERGRILAQALREIAEAAEDDEEEED